MSSPSPPGQAMWLSNLLLLDMTSRCENRSLMRGEKKKVQERVTVNKSVNTTTVDNI